MTHSRPLPLTLALSLLTTAPAAWGASLLARLGLESSPVPALDTLATFPQPSATLTAYAEGLDLIAAGRFPDAVNPLTRAIELEEENAEYLLARGVALLLAEKVSAGRKDLERAYRLEPANDDVRRMLAFSVRLEGDEMTAPKYYSHVSTDPYDQFLLKTGNDYGAVVLSSRVPSQEYQERAQERRKAAVEQFAQIGRMFAQRHKGVGAIAAALGARGVQRFKAGQAASAEEDLAAAIESNPDDLTLGYYHAAALIQLNRVEQGRREMSAVLCWQPALPEGYCQRAMAAAKMGDLTRAESDLQLAALLDAKDARQGQAAAKKVVAECKRATPAVTPATASEELLAAARSQEPFAQLADKAERLVRAANDHRVHGDEVYQERRRQLSWALATDAHNPDKLAALGRFLLDEADVSGECVEPNGQWVSYRAQSARQQSNELHYARELIGSALKISPKHVSGLIGQAALEMRSFQWANAENLLRQAMQWRQDDPEILALMSRIMQVAADQRSAKAAELREVKTWTEYGYNVTWYYSHYPSLAERERADEYERKAAELIASSKQYFRKALQACAGTALGFYYEGTLAWSEQNLEAARKAFEQAAKLAPADRRIQHDLANLYAKLGLIDAAMERQAMAKNLQQTTAAPWLQRAWSKIVNNAWKTSRAALDKAAALDPADARIFAYAGAIAAAQEQPEEAIACYRAALALEEAHGHFRGTTYQGGTGAWPVNDFGRALEIRLRLGRLLAAQNPAQAAVLFLENVALEDRITEWGFSSKVQTAMLPDPEQDLRSVPFPPIAGALFRKSRALAGMALTRDGRFKEAVVMFDRLEGYEARLRGGGTAYLDTGDDVSKSVEVAIAATEANTAAGAPFKAVHWLQLAEQRANTQRAQGQNPAQTPELQRVREKMLAAVRAAYATLHEQALSEIKAASTNDRDHVREQWEQKLRPVYTASQTYLNEQGVAPPWQTLFAQDDFRANGRSYRQREQVPAEATGSRGQNGRPVRRGQQPPPGQKEAAGRDWFQQELERIGKLPPNEQRSALEELDRRLAESERQGREKPVR